MDTITYASLTSILIVLVGWLLANKDTKQGELIVKQDEQIAILFKKHDDDAAALAALRVEIAKEHYLKHELDSRFHSLEQAIKESSHTLGLKFDHLAETLVAHLIDGGKR